MSGPKSMLEATVLLNSAGSAANNFNKLNERSSNLAVIAGRAKRDSIVAMINRVYDSNIQVTPGFVQIASRYTTRSVDPSRIASVPDYSARVLSEISSAGLGAFVQNPELQNFMQLVIRKDLNPAVVEKTVKQVEDSGIAPLDPVLAAEVLLTEQTKQPSAESESHVSEDTEPGDFDLPDTYSIGSDTASGVSMGTFQYRADQYNAASILGKEGHLTASDIEDLLDEVGTHEEQEYYSKYGKLPRSFFINALDEYEGYNAERSDKSTAELNAEFLKSAEILRAIRGRREGVPVPKLRREKRMGTMADIVDPKGKVSTVASTTGGFGSVATAGVSGTVTEVVQPPVRPRRGAMGPVEMAAAGVSSGTASETESSEEDFSDLPELEPVPPTESATGSGPPITPSASEGAGTPATPQEEVEAENADKPSERERPEGDILIPKSTDEFAPTVYHRDAITVFFNSADSPSWDPQLSANIKNAYKDASADALKDLIKNIIFTKGQNFLVVRPKSDGTLQELAEIIQLLFSSKRNMSRGPRVTMAGVSLGSLLGNSGSDMHRSQRTRREAPAAPAGGAPTATTDGAPASSPTVYTPDDLQAFRIPLGESNLLPVDTPTAIKNAADSYQRSANFHGFGSTGPRIIYPILTGSMNRDTVGPGLTWLDQFPKGTKFKINLDPCEQ